MSAAYGSSESHTTEPINPQAAAIALTDLPAALFIGDVSGPLNAEACALAGALDPKLEEIKADIDATLELCHPGNVPSADQWQEEIEAVRLGVQSLMAMATSLLNGTYVVQRARVRLHRGPSLTSIGGARSAGTGGREPSLADEFVLQL